ncbi:MAG: glycosyltransferase family 8 protein [Candidatus Nanoarchaeia archaeon]|nr:glycosyltransferase family 8 protein [Candidatus Nanoarchaeia archaeon]
MENCHICYCVDKGFEKYAIASIISMFLNSNIKPKIHIIHNKFTDKKKLKLAEKLFKTKFKYYLTDDKLFYGLPVLGGYSSYYRILIPELLPKNIDKILYLDCDTIVENDLTGLFSMDLAKHALAAVEDVVTLKSDFKNLKKRLKIPKDKSYFNSGVMMFNLDFMRENNSAKKIISFLHKNVDKIVMHDQDGLNAILFNYWIKLPETYNYIINVDLIFPKNINPKIIHFAGLKPEMVKILAPGNIYCKKYYEYLDLAKYPKEEITRDDIKKLIKRLYKILFETGFFF